jgi:hypothetical protein
VGRSMAFTDGRVLAYADNGLAWESVEVAMLRLDAWHSLASRANGLNGLMAARDTDMAYVACCLDSCANEMEV